MFRLGHTVGLMLTIFGMALAIVVANPATSAERDKSSGRGHKSELGSQKHKYNPQQIGRTGKVHRRSVNRRHSVNRRQKVGNRNYQRNRGHYRSHYRRDHRGTGIGILGIVINEAFQDERRSDFQRCDDRYASFDWSDGTYQPYGDGPRVLCPYLG